MGSTALGFRVAGGAGQHPREPRRNAFNLMDGIDGLAGTLALVSITTMALFIGAGDVYRSMMLMAVLAASLLPYPACNLGLTWRKIFLGDVGSMVLGYLILPPVTHQSEGIARKRAPNLPPRLIPGFTWTRHGTFESRISTRSRVSKARFFLTPEGQDINDIVGRFMAIKRHVAGIAEINHQLTQHRCSGNERPISDNVSDNANCRPMA